MKVARRNRQAPPCAEALADIWTDPCPWLAKLYSRFFMGDFPAPPSWARDSRRPAAMSLTLFPAERLNTDVEARRRSVGLSRTRKSSPRWIGSCEAPAAHARSRIRRTVLACQPPPCLVGTSIELSPPAISRRERPLVRRSRIMRIAAARAVRQQLVVLIVKAERLARISHT